MKKWSILLATSLVVLGVIVAPIAVFAQNETNGAVTQDVNFRTGLALVAPRGTLAGEQMSLTVFNRPDQQPVASVGIWVVGMDKVDALKAEAQALRQNDAVTPENKDYETIINKYAGFIGRTDGKGKLFHTFNDPGKFLLVAFKKGYYPDWSHLTVVHLPKVLAIEAPAVTNVHANVNIKVFQRGVQEPVAGAGVWAVTKDKLEALKSAVQTLKNDTAVAAENKDYEAVVSAHAILLGRTDENGKLQHTFTEPGRYLLVTVKKGYIPGIATIGVREPPSPTVSAK